MRIVHLALHRAEFPGHVAREEASKRTLMVWSRIVVAFLGHDLVVPPKPVTRQNQS
jgi:hypothetical protein